MPELPEVETVKKGLTQLVLGKKIETVSVLWPKIVETDDTRKFENNLIGETIERIERRGKFLIFKLSHYDLISHLRMEGKYEFHHQASDACSKHTHMRITFNDHTELRYLDVRKFGRFQLFPKDGYHQYAGIQKLGPEPVLPDFKLHVFQKQLSKTSRKIKPLLLDQTLVTGLGNIYVDEALYAAKIHPERLANGLNLKEVQKLHESIIRILHEAVESGGTTIRTYKNALGDAGHFQQSLCVYGQTGSACKRCGSEIVKIKVAQRGTHFCPTCQVIEFQE